MSRGYVRQSIVSGDRVRSDLPSALRCVLSALLFLGLASVASTAFAQEMTFGEDEVEEVKEASPVGKFLEEGVKFYDNKDYYQASLRFHRVLAEEDASADKFRLKAQYEMAKTQYRLGLYQGALNIFDQIIEAGEEHPFYEVSLSWLILISRKMPGDPNLLSRMVKFVDYYPDRVPEKFRDEFAFLLGKAFYNEADLDRALEFLVQVPPSAAQYPDAKFLEGITDVRKFEAKPAVAAFKAILAYVAEHGTDDPKMSRLEQLTLLSMGRTFYSVGQYDKAVKYYGFIPQSSPYWLESLFEESWAQFQLDNFNKSLGNLHSLNSPFFDDQYVPESMILTAVVLFTNCRYDRVRYTIKEEFEQVYPALKKQLEEYLAQYEDPAEFYAFLLKINEGNGDFDPRLNQILDAALTDKTLKRTIGYIEEIDHELELIDKADPSWRDSDLGQTLMQDLAVTKSFALSDAGGLARSRMERVVAELKDLIKQGKKILVETAKAESNALDQQIKDEQFKAQASWDPQAVEVDDEHIYWSFRGEYWRDELGYYLYNITPQCGR